MSSHLAFWFDISTAKTLIHTLRSVFLHFQENFLLQFSHPPANTQSIYRESRYHLSHFPPSFFKYRSFQFPPNEKKILRDFYFFSEGNRVVRAFSPRMNFIKVSVERGENERREILTRFPFFVRFPASEFLAGHAGWDERDASEMKFWREESGASFVVLKKKIQKSTYFLSFNFYLIFMTENKGQFKLKHGEKFHYQTSTVHLAIWILLMLATISAVSAEIGSRSAIFSRSLWRFLKVEEWLWLYNFFLLVHNLNVFWWKIVIGNEFWKFIIAYPILVLLLWKSDFN